MPKRRATPPRADSAVENSHDIGVLLTLALGAFKERMHTELAKGGYDDLGPSFGFVFRSLADRPLSLVELAARLRITSQGALKIVNEMIERGYVERADDAEDRRVRRLLLTVRGRGALRAARRFHAAVERELVAEFGAARVAGGRALLDALVRNGPTNASSATWANGAATDGSRPF